MIPNEPRCLRSAIAQTHSLSEFRVLCFDLGIDYEHIPGDEKLSKIVGLITYCQRVQQLEDLQQHLKFTRPAIPWKDLFIELKKTSALWLSNIPLQLPSPVEHFTGRKREIKRLRKKLFPGHTVTLWGPGGIGKTALASTAINQLYQSGDLLTRFPDGVIFYTFCGSPAIEDAFDHIIHELRLKFTACQTASFEGETHEVVFNGVDCKRPFPLPYLKIFKSKKIEFIQALYETPWHDTVLEQFTGLIAAIVGNQIKSGYRVVAVA